MVNLEKYLSETKYCNFNHPDVKKIALEITKDCKNDKEKAIALFYWVRDNINYSIGFWQQKASDTMSLKNGTCTNKSNLLVAFLRYTGVPAGFGVMKVDGKNYFGPIATPYFTPLIGRFSTHVYTVIYLGGKFIKCDPSDDILLCKKTMHFNYTTEIVNWDGLNDAMLNIHKKNILSDYYPIDNIDYLFIKKFKYLKKIPFEVGNYYINYIRTSERIFTDEKQLEQEFKKWLYKNHFYKYLFFNMIRALFIFKNKKHE